MLITIYWLGRRAQCDHWYDGPYLNFKAFEGLLGTALYKVKVSVGICPIVHSELSACTVRKQKHHFLEGTRNRVSEILFLQLLPSTCLYPPRYVDYVWMKDC